MLIIIYSLNCLFLHIECTNYDKLIEKALENNGKICDIKTCCANLTTTLKGRNVVVYKMHGDVDHQKMLY